MKSSTRALCLAACSWLASACSSTTSTSDVSRGPDGFAVESVATVATTVKASGDELSVDCSEPLLVSVSPEVDSDGKMGGAFLLAPPGSCGSVTDCGWIVLTVDSSNSECKTFETASASSPLRVDLPAACRNGTLTFHAELRDADGAPVLTETDEPLAAEFTVKVKTLFSECVPTE